MGIIGSRKIADYIAAFAHFGGLNHTYQTRPFGRHALINDSIEIYQASHFSDLVADYRTYFKADYSEIYLQFPAELWDALLLEKFHLVPDDVIIELYKSWKSFWRGQLPNTSKQDKSLSKFHLMSAQIQSGATLIESVAVDEPILITVLALTVKRLYQNADLFYSDCVQLMTSSYVDQIGDERLFVKVGPEDYPDDQTYFIYTVDEDF